MNTKTRKKELDTLRQEELNYVNLRQQAKGKATFISYEDYENYQTEQASLTDSQPELDFIAHESGEILVDILTEDLLIADNHI